MVNSKKPDVAVSVIDAEEVLELEKKKQKINRVMEIIKEEGLDDDSEFMKEITEAIKESI